MGSRKIENINAVVLALLPALAVYEVKGFNLRIAFFIQALLVALNLRNLLSRKTKETSLMWQFIGLIYVLTIIHYVVYMSDLWFSTTLLQNNLISLTLMFLTIITLIPNTNAKLFARASMFVGIVAASICIYQRMQLIVTGRYDNIFFIPGLYLARDAETMTITRPSAFFSEPAHLAIYVLPLAYYAFIMRKYLLYMLLAAAILLSGSTTGFVILAAITLIALCQNKIKTIYKALIISSLVIGFIGIVAISPDMLAYNMDKLSGVDESVRVAGPLDYIKKYSVINWFFGVGLNQLSGFLSFSCSANAEGGNFANAIIYMYLSYGIFMWVYFIHWLFKLWKRHKKNAGFFVVLLGVLASDQVLFNVNFIYPLMFVYFSNYYTIEKSRV